MLQMRAVSVCHRTEGQNVPEQTWPEVEEERERFPITGNEAGRAQAEVSGPSVPVRGASLRMMSIRKEKPVLAAQSHLLD